jgi:hypothetical protein
MPIRPENRARYPADWPEISRRIRFDRAGGRCECAGECGLTHEGGRCSAWHGQLRGDDKRPVTLTVAHLPGREIEQCGDDDLKAMCERCHNRMDAPARRRGIRERARAAMGVIRDLFDA